MFNLIKSYKFLPSYGGGCSIPYSKKIKSHDVTIRTLTFFNQKFKLVKITKTFSNPTSKFHVLAGKPQITFQNWNNRNDVDAFSIFKKNYIRWRDDIDDIKDIKVISDHMKKHAKPPTDEAFAYYMAGLIEANGAILEDRVEINLNNRDVSLAYFIKSRMGFGSVRKINNENESLVKYFITNQSGLKAFAELVNGKFLTKDKVNQLLKYEYNQKYGITVLPPADFDIDENHFLAGFCDADSSFRVETLNDNNNIRILKIKLCFYLGTETEQKDPTIFNKVKAKFGGHVHFDEKTGNYRYETTTFKSSYKIIKYFDRCHLNSTKHVDFFKWRKSYRIIQRGEHLEGNGTRKLLKMKKSIVKFRSLKDV